MTCIKFHMSLREIDMQKVMANYQRMHVLHATCTVSMVKSWISYSV